MRITVLTTAHRWNDPRVFVKQARSLAAAGFEVSLAAVGAPTGTVDGVRMLPMRPYRTRLGRMTGGLWQSLRLGLSDCDAVHVHDPELLAIMPIVRVARRGRVLVYDAHEDYAAQLREKPWLPRRLRPGLSWFLDRLERAVARRCDLVVAATPAIGRRFADTRVVTVENFPDLSGFPDVGPAADPSVCRMIHVGEMNARRGACELLEALGRLPDDSRIEFEQLGPVKPSELLDVSEPRLTVSAQVPPEDAWATMAEATAGVILFHDGPNHSESQPNKLFEYLVAGLPVLASDIEHWRSLTSAVGATAVFVDPRSPASIGEGLVELERVATSHDRLAAARRARAAFDWASQSQILVDAYNDLELEQPHDDRA